MKIVPLEIIKPQPNQDAIDHAKNLLEHVESGEMNEVVYIGFRPDGSYLIGITPIINTKEKIGLLFQIIMDMNDLSKD